MKRMRKEMPQVEGLAQNHRDTIDFDGFPEVNLISAAHLEMTD